jgi:pyruvate dehydrogenase E2 component (dihydrolipoamide acetyltransferase)
MAYEFKLPDIGEGVVEGEIVRWLVAEGDVLRQDQPMVEIMTDKATVEIPAPRAGRVVKRMYAEGQTCPVGKVLIAIDEGEQAAPEERAAAAPAASRSPATPVAAARSTSGIGQPAAPGAGSSQPAGSGSSQPAASASGLPAGAASGVATVLATPATRKLARDLGVDLAAVTASGPGGRITSDDVRAARTGSGNGHPAVAAVAARPLTGVAGPDVRLPFRGLRRRIAENLVRSRRETADFTYVEEVDCTQLVDLRDKANTRLRAQGIKLSYLPFIVRAVVDALKKFPQLNATLDEPAGEIVQRHEYHIGIAAQTEDGLVVPVVRHADRRSIVELAQEIDRLAAVTKTGKATREELSGSTFTISSLGSLGGVLATSIINHPEVAILGVHKIAKRPAILEDKIVVRDLMNMSISADHRLVDGYDAARFVAEIKESLQAPGLLFLEAI